MGSSEKGKNQKNNKIFSSSSSSSSNPKSPEVWDDMNVPSLPKENLPMTFKDFRGVNLQDNLTQPFAKNPDKQPNFAQPTKLTTISNDKPYMGFGSSYPSENRGPDPDENIEDRRTRRMRMNRESAARSRDREKETARTLELEAQVAKLTAEKQRLEKRQEHMKKFRLLQEACRPPKKTLRRTSSALI